EGRRGPDCGACGAGPRGSAQPRDRDGEPGRRSIAMTNAIAGLLSVPLGKRLLVLLLGLCTVSGSGFAQSPAALEMSAAELERLGIEWIRPERVGGRVVLEAPAVVAVPPSRETVVSATVGGLVTRLHVAEGSEVDAGDPLVELRSL